MLAEHFDGFHDFGVSDGFGGHEELQLVDAGCFVKFGSLDAALGVSGDDHAAVGQGIGIELLPDFLGQGSPARQIHRTGFTGFAFGLDVDIARKILLQMLGDPAPLVEQTGVNVLLVLHVGSAGTEEGFERVGAELPGSRAVGSAKPKGRS